MKSKNWLYLAIALAGFVASGACSDDEQPHDCPGAGGSSMQSCDSGESCDVCMASACAQGVCQDDIAACAANPDCEKFGSCLEACSSDPDPDTCTGNCGMMYMGGILDFGNKLSCLVCNQQACYGDCEGPQNCGAGGGVVGGGPPTGGGAPSGGGGSTSTGGQSAGGGNQGGSGG